MSDRVFGVRVLVGVRSRSARCGSVCVQSVRLHGPGTRPHRGDTGMIVAWSPKRIEAEALEEQKQKHFLELERQRQSVIAQKEEEWALKEEAQRKKDEATILYIREARERRRQEKEAEKLELEEELKRQQKLEQVRLSFLQILSFAFLPAHLLMRSTRPSKRNAF